MILRQLLTLSILSLISISSFAAPNFGGAGRFRNSQIDSRITSRDSDRTSDKSKNSNHGNETDLERLQRYQAEKATLSKLQLSRDQMKSLTREFKDNPNEFASLQRLIQSAITAKTSADSALLKNYFQLLSFTGGTFHLTPTVLEQRINNWSQTTKENLAAVLETSVQMSRNDNVVVREEAFEKALKKFGLDSEYQKKCRRS